MNTLSITHRSQCGAALVVGLLLLVVLTLLAISGVNTASLELVMAGNAQFYQNAFQSAESGIERALASGTFNPGAAPQTVADTGEKFSSVITPQLSGAPQQALWGTSWDSFSTYHFEIQSIGTSTRSAQATNFQGVAVIAPVDTTVAPVGATTLLE